MKVSEQPYLSKVLQDIIDDYLLGLIWVYSSERIHVNDCVLKLDERCSEGSL